MNTKNMRGFSMTNRKRPANSFGSVKKYLIAGTFAATMIGTQLIGQQDTVVNFNEQVTVVVPATQSQEVYALPPTFNRNNRGDQIQLKAIPQAVTPNINPVARTRSSQ